MEAKYAEEYAAYRFHRKLRLMARIAFFYNLSHNNYILAFVYHMLWTLEIIATEKHLRAIKQTAWYEKQKSRRVKALHD